MNTTEIRELLSKATPRPWVVDGFAQRNEQQTRIALPDRYGIPGETVALALSSIDRNDATYISVPRAVRNAALIVALVNNAEELLDAVERLRDALIFIRDKEQAALNEAESLRFNIPEEAGCMEILHAARAALEQKP